MTTPPTQLGDKASRTPLVNGNEALRQGNYGEAITHYAQVIVLQPELAKSIIANLSIASQKYRAIRRSIKKPSVGVCGWELAHNAAGRVYTLATIYETFAHVEIIGSLFPSFGREIWKPIRDTSIAKHSFVVEDESRFIEQAVQLVAAHPYDIVHLSKPRAPNIFFGILYKLLWGAKVLMDIDDEELAFVDATTPISIGDYMQQHGKLPDLKNLAGKDWTRLTVGLAKEFDGVTVCNSVLQECYGGEIIHHARNEQRYQPAPEHKCRSRETHGIPQDKKVVLFFVTPGEHKGPVVTAEAIAALSRTDILFVLVGDFLDSALKQRLQAIPGVEYRFIDNHPIAAIPDVVAIADLCILLQNPETLAAQFQVPACLSDALGMGVPVLATQIPALDNAVVANAIQPVTSDDLTQSLAQVLDDPVNSARLQATGRGYFESILSTEVNRRWLQRALAQAEWGPLNVAMVDMLKGVDYGTLSELLHQPRTHPISHSISKNPELASFSSRIPAAPYSCLLGLIPNSPSDGKNHGGSGVYRADENILLRNIRYYNKAKKSRSARIAYFTAISNNYDPLIVPESICTEWDYFVFSDTPIFGEHIFDVRLINIPHNDPVRFARYVKTHPHTLLRNYDYVIWVDANILIKGMHLYESVKKAMDSQALMFVNPHPDRKCVTSELEMCKRRSKDRFEVMERQVAKYLNEGFPLNYGMIESGILIRNNNHQKIKEFNNAWWEELSKHSSRDQLSVMYLLWKHDVPFRYLENMKDVRKHENNDYCLFPHGGQATKYLPAYQSPNFMRKASTVSQANLSKQDQRILKEVINYWSNKKTSQKKVVVYTAITNNYDVLKIPNSLNSDWDYICFTDRSSIPGYHPWEIRHFDYLSQDDVLTARFVKTHPHYYFSEYEISIWIDAHLLIREDFLSQFVEYVTTSPCGLGAIPHPFRNCTYEEAKICVDEEKDDKTIIHNQVEIYRQKGFPEKYGLIETGILIRKHNLKEIKQLNIDWWLQQEKGSKRDQISFMYMIWMHGIQWLPLMKKGRSVRNHQGFQFFQHGFKSTARDKKYVLPTFLPQSFAYDRKPFWTEREPIIPFGFLNQFQAIRTDIVICVHNALEDVKRCLDSVSKTTLESQNIIIIDDGSEEETSQYLEYFTDSSIRTRLIRNESALGYTKSANIGLKASNAEFVVLLNSDTVVPCNWTLKLIHAAYSRPYIGIVGPLSNAASWQSIPLLRDPRTKKSLVNDLPNAFTVDQMDQFVQNYGTVTHFPLVPLVNGFCYGIKRSVIEAIGYFDEDSFPRGYGEEDDYSMRAQNAGFQLAIATHLYVYHAKSKSFGIEARLQHAKKGREVLLAKHGEQRITRAVELIQYHPILISVREKCCIGLGIEPEVYVKKELAIPGDNSSPSSSHQENKIGNIEQRQFELKQLVSLDSKIFPSELLLANITWQEIQENEKLISTIQKTWNGIPKHALWILPAFRNLLAGGVRTILMVAEDWSKHWSTHNEIILLKSSSRTSFKFDERQILSYFPNLKFKMTLLDAESNIGALLPTTDIGVCSSWPTAYMLAKYNKCKAKFYFMQDYETLFYPAGAVSGLIDATYGFGFIGICNSKGIADRYSEFSKSYYCFKPGVSREIFYPRETDYQKTNDVFQIFFYGRPNNERNAFPIGLQALAKVKHYFGDRVRIVSAGGKWSPSEYNLEGIIENCGILSSMDEIADLYRNSNLGLVFMLTPHPSYQPFEFMASGCVTVTNTNPSTSWLLIDGVNSILTSLFPDEIAGKIIYALEHPNYLARLRQGGLETISTLSWEKTFREIREFVCNLKV
ncbi:glycosyltransferase domain-containing protein [Thiorhodococcus fuscus]|uniref:Glycosyltransferase domain-containing protein n=1 Tax=Thiorhodococcus fuscus TaxID=527200 RepID=A0ABW4YEV8_9GAMM